MREIVICCQHGGFCISRKAFLKLRELGCKAALEEPDYGEFWPDGSGPRKDGPFGDHFGKDIERDDPLLVKVVKEMGEEADGDCASLKIVSIPDDVEWQIEEYDGLEWIAEKHRIWD